VIDGQTDEPLAIRPLCGLFNNQSYQGPEACGLGSVAEYDHLVSWSSGVKGEGSFLSLYSVLFSVSECI